MVRFVDHPNIQRLSLYDLDPCLQTRNSRKITYRLFLWNLNGPMSHHYQLPVGFSIPNQNIPKRRHANCVPLSAITIHGSDSLRRPSPIMSPHCRVPVSHVARLSKLSYRHTRLTAGDEARPLNNPRYFRLTIEKVRTCVIFSSLLFRPWISRPSLHNKFWPWRIHRSMW